MYYSKSKWNNLLWLLYFSITNWILNTHWILQICRWFQDHYNSDDAHSYIREILFCKPTAWYHWREGEDKLDGITNNYHCNYHLYGLPNNQRNFFNFRNWMDNLLRVLQWRQSWRVCSCTFLHVANQNLDAQVKIKNNNHEKNVPPNGFNSVYQWKKIQIIFYQVICDDGSCEKEVHS